MRSAGVLSSVVVAGCQSLPLERTGALGSYANLQPANGLVTKAQVWVDAAAVGHARTIRLKPTAFAAAARTEGLSQKQRSLVANAVNRSLCIGLSERFTVVPITQPADLTVQVFITRIEPTDEAAAGVSKVASFVPSLVGVPVPVPRIPIGLGSLSLEAEALNSRGEQKAALVWARGASVLGSSATVSSAGDAYALAGSFGSDLSHLIAKGESPFGAAPSLPSTDSIGSALGAAPKHAACESFGRGAGITGFIGARLGIPPEWTDDGKAGEL